MRERHSPSEIILLWAKPSNAVFLAEEGLPVYSIFCKDAAKSLREKLLLLVYALSVL